MLEIRNLNITINEKEYIKDLNIKINAHDKLAIIGEEGNGKSTLLKAIYDFELVPYAKIVGNINHKNYTLGYLSQTLDETNQSVLDFLELNDYHYQERKEMYKGLKDFNLDGTILEKTVSSLSGGEKVKVSLLKLLLKNPDILLLDEPSNDLDIETLTWLENFIVNESKPVIFISHDETLLEKTANRILHIELLKHKEEAKHTISNISYKDYIDTRNNAITHQTELAHKEQQNFKKQQEKLQQVMQKVEYQQNTITRSDPHGARLLKKKMKSLKSQEKRQKNTVRVTVPDQEETINLFFEPVFIPPNKLIISYHKSPLKVENIILTKEVNLEVKGQEHIVIIGKNGAGKTTLLKEIIKELSTKSDIKVGYMPQNYEEVLDESITPIAFLTSSSDVKELTKVRSFLGNSNFTKEEMTSSIETLSGGSKAKLFLLYFIYNKCNVLVLDEPTRNLSPLSNPIICKILKNYTGTIISVSHDRNYIKEVGDKVYELTEENLHLIKKIHE